MKLERNFNAIVVTCSKTTRGGATSTFLLISDPERSELAFPCLSVVSERTSCFNVNNNNGNGDTVATKTVSADVSKEDELTEETKRRQEAAQGLLLLRQTAFNRDPAIQHLTKDEHSAIEGLLALSLPCQSTENNVKMGQCSADGRTSRDVKDGAEALLFFSSSCRTKTAPSLQELERGAAQGLMTLRSASASTCTDLVEDLAGFDHESNQYPDHSVLTSREEAGDDWRPTTKITKREWQIHFEGDVGRSSPSRQSLHTQRSRQQHYSPVKWMHNYSTASKQFHHSTGTNSRSCCRRAKYQI